LYTAALLLAILTRLVFILLPRVPFETKAVTAIGDSREYIALAHNLVSSHTFTRDTVPPFRPELFRTPGYPLLLTVPFIVHRSSFIATALVLQLLLALLTVGLTSRLALELGLRPVTSALAALLVGLSPSLAFLSTKLISETLFTPMLLICLLSSTAIASPAGHSTSSAPVSPAACSSWSVRSPPSSRSSSHSTFSGMRPDLEIGD
jgi:hypothetical protein